MLFTKSKKINVRDYFIRLSVLIACVPIKIYKYQMFLWWRLFSSFADSLKILEGGIHFNPFVSNALSLYLLNRKSFLMLSGGKEKVDWEQMGSIDREKTMV